MAMSSLQSPQDLPSHYCSKEWKVLQFWNSVRLVCVSNIDENCLLLRSSVSPRRSLTLSRKKKSHAWGQYPNSIYFSFLRFSSAFKIKYYLLFKHSQVLCKKSSRKTYFLVVPSLLNSTSFFLTLLFTG